jgi:hypothetical protein
MKHLFLLMLITSCGQKEIRDSHKAMEKTGASIIFNAYPKKSDGRLLPYQNQFQKRFNNKTIVAVFSKENDELVGAKCQIIGDGNKYIEVNEYLWNNPPYPYFQEFIEEYREMVMFHENGHCALGLSHRFEMVETPEGSWPEFTHKSLMNSVLEIDPTLYRNYRESFINELTTNELTF